MALFIRSGGSNVKKNIFRNFAALASSILFTHTKLRNLFFQHYLLVEKFVAQCLERGFLVGFSYKEGDVVVAAAV